MSSRPKDHDGSNEWSLPGDEAILADLLPPLDDRPGPARRLGSAASAAMVRSIVDAALEVHVDGERVSEIQRDPRTAWGIRRIAASAAVVMAVVSFGAVAAALVGRYVSRAPVKAVEPPPAAPAVKPSWRAAAPLPATQEEVMDPPAPAPIAPPQEPPPRKRRHVTRPLRSSPGSVHAAQSLGAPVAPEIDLEKTPPEDLLALANERRRAHLWHEADDLYQTVIRRFPKADAAVVAEIASASLHLDTLGDPSGALESFRRALAARPRGPLAEEARWGIAEAWRALGDGARESAALGEFLAHHPSSALAPAAHRRQGELAR